jgi:hypothetical protein
VDTTRRRLEANMLPPLGARPIAEIWDIPATRMKMKTPHIVPLNPTRRA